MLMHFPGGVRDKEPTYQCRRCKRLGFNPRVGKIAWRKAWQPNPVFLPGEPHGQRSLAGYSPQVCKELDMTEGTQHTHSTHCIYTYSKNMSGTEYSCHFKVKK